MPSESKDKIRRNIAHRLRALRQARDLTQAQLARQLGMSQPRLSQIEAGAASLTAEQFVLLLQILQATVADFVPPMGPSPTSELQASLARLGAAELQEDGTTLPSERLERATDAIRETLIDASEPRLLTALAPVIVQNIENIHWPRLAMQLSAAGFERRWSWLVENVLEAVRHEADDASVPLRDRRRYRRTETVLRELERHWRVADPREAGAPDVLERDIRTKRSLEEVLARASAISRRHGVASSLQPADFIEALRGARVVA